MDLSTLTPPRGSRKQRKRVGRGEGSGHGGTSCKGHKGQKARSGGKTALGFEGGQMPLHRRVPKRGFTNIFREEYAIVNLDRLAALGQTEITPDVLKKAGVIHGKKPVKVLGDGELTKKLTVCANAFSATAKAKIEAKGGKCEVVGKKSDTAKA